MSAIHICAKCGASFDHLKHLRQHESRKTPCNPSLEPEKMQKLGATHKCKHCGKMFNKVSGMYRHANKYCKMRGISRIVLQDRAVSFLQEKITTKKKEYDKVCKDLEEIKAFPEKHVIKEVKIPQEFKQKSKKLPAALRNAVWNTYIGAETGKSICFCCGVESISRGVYECGHVQSKASGGSDMLSNLRPVCGLCNKSMGTRNMVEFIKDCGFITMAISNAEGDVFDETSLAMTDEESNALYSAD